MDKQEKIARIIRAETEGGYLRGWEEHRLLLSQEQQLDYFLGLGKIILRELKKLPKGKPPLLNDEVLDDCYFNPPTTIANEFKDYQEVNRYIANTQREADIEWYEGKK